MNKKLIALAIASAFAVPGTALAQGSSVTIYGTLNVDFENVEADEGTGLDFDQRNRVSSNSSNIGFRGTEDLGNGLKGIFQLESSLNMDTGAGGLGSRNSHVGLSGPWGTVFYGIWDTPYKFVSLKQDAWYATGIAANNFIVGTPGFGVATATQSAPGAPGTAANASFDRRQGDSVQYWTPSFNGLSARFMYSANEGKTADDVAIELDPFTYGLALIYENGPLYLNVAAERHEDYFGLASLFGAVAAPTAANDASEDTGYKAGIGYTFGNTTLHAVYERLDYEVDTAALDDFERDAAFLALLHKIGAWTVRASYGHAFEADFDDDTGVFDDEDTDADFYTIGASYSFSKRTELYGLYMLIDNGDGAAYNFGEVKQLGTFSPATPAATVGLGAELRGIALGIRHSF